MNMVNSELANKLFSWALVRQVATCRFHACVYRRRSFYRIYNALTEQNLMPLSERFHISHDPLLMILSRVV